MWIRYPRLFSNLIHCNQNKCYFQPPPTQSLPRGSSVKAIVPCVCPMCLSVCVLSWLNRLTYKQGRSAWTISRSRSMGKVNGQGHQVKKLKFHCGIVILLPSSNSIWILCDQLTNCWHPNLYHIQRLHHVVMVFLAPSCPKTASCGDGLFGPIMSKDGFHWKPKGPKQPTVHAGCQQFVSWSHNVQMLLEWWGIRNKIFRL